MRKKFISILLSAVITTSFTTVLADDNIDDTVLVNTTISETANTSDDDLYEDNIIITSNEKVLTKDVDYILSYENNVNVGEATVIITFIGNYSGKTERKFNIVRKTVSGGSGGGGGSSSASTTTIVTVVDDKGNNVNVKKAVNNGTVTVTLPNNKNLEDSTYTITVTDSKGKAKADTKVIIKDSNSNSAEGNTDSNGKVTLPVTAETTPSPLPTTTPETTPLPLPTTTPEIHIAYIKGYTDGTFIPDGNITRAETAAILSRVMTFDTKDNNITFSDVADNLWYSEPIAIMSSAGMIKGYADGTFRPDNQITRAEFVAMLMRNLGVEKYQDLPFNDVYPEIWSTDYIYSAYTAGYINGYEDGSFRPDSPITRAEVVKIINLVLGRDDYNDNDNPFSDVKNSHWAYKYILEAAVEH